MPANHSPDVSRRNGALGGRPKGSKRALPVNREILAKLCLKNFRKHVEYLEWIAAHSESHQARISAIVVLWERGLGKVPQAGTGEGGGPVVLQVVCGVATPEDWGDWQEPKALAAPVEPASSDGPLEGDSSTGRT
jgi:hypothetical protein